MTTDYWEVPVLGAALLEPRTIVFRAETGRVLMMPTPGDDVLVPDTQVDTLCVAARSALDVARTQRARTP